MTRNEGVLLQRTVRHLLHTLPADAEILIVDDASTDGSTKPFGTGRGRIRVLRSTRRLGIAAARNLGADESRGDIIIWSDAHVRPHRGWFEPLARALSIPEAGAAGPALVPFGRTDVRVFGLAFSDEALNVEWLRSHEAAPHPVPLLPGCFMAMRRDVLRSVGGFDSGMVGYGAEDLEMCLRLWRRGFDCLMVPRAVVAHRFRRHPKADIEWELFMVNLLRMGVLHLSGDNLTRFIDVLRRHSAFDRALARVMTSDAYRRRAELRAEARFDDAWFFRRFERHLFLDSKMQDQAGGGKP